MSQDPADFSSPQPARDPYAPPQETGYAPPPGSQVRSAPGGLTAICIIAIILGGLGVANALMSGVGLLVGNQMQNMFGAPPAGPNPEAARIQREMNEELTRIQNRFLFPNLAVAVTHLGVAVFLLIAGIKALSRKPRGRTLLIKACAIAVVFELVRMGLNVLVQVQTYAALRPFLDDLTQSTGPQGPPEGFVGALTLGIIIAGLAFAAGFMLLKVGFYVYASLYMRRPAILAVYGVAQTTSE